LSRFLHLSLKLCKQTRTTREGESTAVPEAQGIGWCDAKNGWNLSDISAEPVQI